MTDEQLDDGPIVCTPMGSPVLYEDLDDASAAAKALVKGGTVRGAFVQVLRPVALYTPTSQGMLEQPEKPEGN